MLIKMESIFGNNVLILLNSDHVNTPLVYVMSKKDVFGVTLLKYKLVVNKPEHVICKSIKISLLKLEDNAGLAMLTEKIINWPLDQMI